MRDVRFTPNSRHWMGHGECLLLTHNGHSARYATPIDRASQNL